MERPMSEISRCGCLKAHTTLSITNLNRVGGKATSASKQYLFIAAINLNRPTRCSGYTLKSAVIISKVGWKTACKMGPTK